MRKVSILLLLLLFGIGPAMFLGRTVQAAQLQQNGTQQIKCDRVPNAQSKRVITGAWLYCHTLDGSTVTETVTMTPTLIATKSFTGVFEAGLVKGTDHQTFTSNSDVITQNYTIAIIAGDNETQWVWVEFVDDWDIGDVINFTPIISGDAAVLALDGNKGFQVINSLPIARADSTTTPHNTGVTVDVLANDEDPDGHTLEVALPATPLSGTITISGSMVVYTPYASESGLTHSVSIHSCDQYDCKRSILTVEVGEAPVAPNTPQGCPIGYRRFNFQRDDGQRYQYGYYGGMPPSWREEGNDDGQVRLSYDTKTQRIIAESDHYGNGFGGGGYVSLANILPYGHNRWWYGEGSGNKIVAWMDVSLLPVECRPKSLPKWENTAPSLLPDEIHLGYNDGATLYVLTNDSDVDGQGLKIVGVTPNSDLPSGLRQLGLSRNRDSILVYSGNKHGSFEFDYTATDGFEERSATVTVHVGGTPPSAVDDTVEVIVGESAMISPLDNDIITAGYDVINFSISDVGTPTDGTATKVGGNQIRYDAPDTAGQYIFTYNMDAGHGITDQAYIYVNVLPVCPTGDRTVHFDNNGQRITFSYYDGIWSLSPEGSARVYFDDTSETLWLESKSGSFTGQGGGGNDELIAQIPAAYDNVNGTVALTFSDKWKEECLPTGYLPADLSVQINPPYQQSNGTASHVVTVTNSSTTATADNVTLALTRSIDGVTVNLETGIDLGPGQSASYPVDSTNLLQKMVEYSFTATADADNVPSAVAADAVACNECYNTLPSRYITVTAGLNYTDILANSIVSSTIISGDFEEYNVWVDEDQVTIGNTASLTQGGWTTVTYQVGAVEYIQSYSVTIQTEANLKVWIEPWDRLSASGLTGIYPTIKNNGPSVAQGIELSYSILTVKEDGSIETIAQSPIDYGIKQTLSISEVDEVSRGFKAQSFIAVVTGTGFAHDPDLSNNYAFYASPNVTASLGVDISAVVQALLSGQAVGDIQISSPVVDSTAQIYPGFPFSYTTVITNNGPEMITGTMTVTRSGVPTTYTVVLGAGESKPIVLTATATSTDVVRGLPIDVSFHFEGLDVNPDDNASTALIVVTATPQISVEKNGPLEAQVNDLITYTIVISNSGVDDVVVTVADLPGHGLSLVGDSERSVQVLAGLTNTVFFTGNASITGTVTNTVNAISTGMITPAIDTATTEVVTTAPVTVDLGLKVVDPISFTTLSEFTRSLTISNKGHNMATGIRITDTYLYVQDRSNSRQSVTYHVTATIAGQSYPMETRNATLGSAVFWLQGAEIAPDQIVIVEMTITGIETNGVLTSTYTVGSDQPDPNLENDSDVAVTCIRCATDTGNGGGGNTTSTNLYLPLISR